MIYLVIGAWRGRELWVGGVRGADRSVEPTRLLRTADV
jgi:hypothetical protein